MHFGATKARAVASLSRALGRPSGAWTSKACAPRFTEVAWHDLIAEFRAGRFTGYRYVRGHARPSPLLETARGITLGNTLGQLRTAYGPLKRSGAVQWTAFNGLEFIEASTVVNPLSSSAPIVEIHIRTCGTDQ